MLCCRSANKHFRFAALMLSMLRLKLKLTGYPKPETQLSLAWDRVFERADCLRGCFCELDHCQFKTVVFIYDKDDGMYALFIKCYASVTVVPVSKL